MTMRASVIISSHNEGELLVRTVASCLDATEDLDFEIVIADDASTDGSIAALERFRDELNGRRGSVPEIRIVSSGSRQGVSPTKDLGARNARGEVLVFLDGHTKPLRGAISHLVMDVEEDEGRSIFVPRIPNLDPVSWKYRRATMGYGFCMDLLSFECGWIGKERMERQGRYYRSPATIGCSIALGRSLFNELKEFDPDMTEWGIEDIDFGFKAWSLGHDTLLDASAVIGHRFRDGFDNYTVADRSILANKLRMARKNFSEAVFEEWVEHNRSIEPRGLWEEAWSLFMERSASVERERQFLESRRCRDAFEYAECHGLEWPVRGKA